MEPEIFPPPEPVTQATMPPRPARLREAREWAVLLALWLAAAAIAAYSLARAREVRIAAELGRLQSQAQATQQLLANQLDGVDKALTGVRALVQQHLGGAEPGLSGQLALLADAVAGVGGILVLDAQGRVVATSPALQPGGSGLAAADLVAARADPDDDRLYVSRPVDSSFGSHVVTLSRSIRGPDGTFAGMAVIALDREYFGVVLRSVLYAPDAVATLSHGDGVGIVSAPVEDAVAGRPIAPPGSMLRRHLDSGEAASVQRGRFVLTGERRLMALRTIAPAALHMDRPLVVGISRAHDEVLAPWLDQVRGIAFGMLLSATAAGMWLWLHQRRHRAQARARHAALQAERDSARRLAVALEGADLGLWEWDIASDTVRLNAREFEMLGLSPQTAPLAPEFWRGLLHAEDRDPVHQAVHEHLRGETPGYRVEHRMRHRDGHWLWVLANARVTQRDEQGRPLRVVGTHLDISERKRTQLELERINGQLEALSLTDGLTGVANRRQFDLTLAAEWARAQRHHHALALLMIDVDHFKRYNDALGHPQGDACLRSLVQTLSSCLRQPQEKLARYGGEEFAVLLTGDMDSGATVAQRCLEALDALRMPHPDSPVAPHVTVSIGVASARPDAEATPEQLVRDADAALYEAKNGGRARYALARPGAPA